MPANPDSTSGMFPLGRKNMMVMGIGLLIVLIGFLLMIGGRSDDPNVYNPDVFNPRRITLAPIVVLSGFVVIGYGIMKKFKE
ncbi:MAG: DUF3098 domain-containing protein [Flavobacteriales bacterium]|nr:DUF3098 domain-containing protein [Flavobacteriales bacterium]